MKESFIGLLLGIGIGQLLLFKFLNIFFKKSFQMIYLLT